MTNKTHRTFRKGFTLVEIMIVVVIIGLLAVMVAPTIDKVRQRAIATRVVNDFRAFSSAFEQFALETGNYPADGTPASIPLGMDGYLKTSQFSAGTPAGGYYDWDYGVFGVVAAISLDGPTVDAQTLLMIDELMDNGNLSSGFIRSRSGGIMYILEE